MLDRVAIALNVVVPVVYGLTALCYLVYFVRNRHGASPLAWAVLLVSLHVGVAFALIRGIGAGHMPLADPGEALSFFALCTLAVYSYLEVRSGTQALGIFIVGTALLFQVAGSLQYAGFSPAPPVLQSAWFAVHATTAVLSFCGFAIAAVASVLYLLLYRELHSRRPGHIFRRIPSLEELDVIALRGVAFGVLLLTAGILTGAMWAREAWGRFWSWDPKEWSSLGVWIVYAAYLLARKRQGWSGRRVAYFALIGFVVLVFTFVIVERVLPTAHKFV